MKRQPPVRRVRRLAALLVITSDGDTSELHDAMALDAAALISEQAAPVRWNKALKAARHYLKQFGRNARTTDSAARANRLYDRERAVLEGERRRRLELELSNAGDRHDADACDRIEAELEALDRPPHTCPHGTDETECDVDCTCGHPCRAHHGNVYGCEDCACTAFTNPTRGTP